MATNEKTTSQHHKVFINFRAELSQSFVPNLKMALLRNGVNAYIVDHDEMMGGDLRNLFFKRIEESRIALAIFSSKYAGSSWCLDELVKIKERVEESKLVAIPVFYKLNPSQVKGLEGDFGLNLWNHVKHTSEYDKLKKWKEALDFVSNKEGLVFSENNDENEFIINITEEVKKVIRILEEQPDARLKLKWVDSETDAKSDANLQAIMRSKSRKGVNVGPNPRKDDIFLGEKNSDKIPNLQNTVESKHGKARQSPTTMETYAKHAPLHEVFINFRGEDVGFSFVSHLVSAMLKKGISVFIDKDERRGEEDIDKLFKKIKNSKLALVVFSSSYSESTWCLNELVKIKECIDEGKLKVIPISYKVEPSEVQQLNGDFGCKLWNFWRLHRDHHIIEWMEALESIASLEAMMSFSLKEDSFESVFVTSIVEEVTKALSKISFKEVHNPETTGVPGGRGEKHETFPNKDPLFGIEQRMEQLEQKLEFHSDETRIIGVVGMPGIGKTTLAMMLHKKWNCKFVRCVPLLNIRKKSNDYGPVINDETTHESVKKELLETKVFVVLDDVSDKKQLEFLLGDLKWIKKGSKIVITACEKSLLEGLAHDTYLVSQLDYKEAFQLFSYHAPDDQTQSRIYVDNAGGNPLALKLMGSKLRGKNTEHKLKRPTRCSKTNTLDVWKFYIDQLNEQQKDVFLDIVWFFKSEDEYFVRSILDSGDPDSTDPVSEVRDLADKFLITISDSRVEMNDLVYSSGKQLGSRGRHKLWKYKDIINKLGKLEKIDRGIFLDMSKVRESIALEPSTFTSMSNLRYLKIYDSYCYRQCKPECKLNFHWVNFPLEELPSDFMPDNLVDLRLPYSNIERVWEGVKDTPKLKLVDLSHSRKDCQMLQISRD